MMARLDFQAWSKAQLLNVEAALDSFIVPHSPAGLGEVMRYGVLGVASAYELCWFWLPAMPLQVIHMRLYARHVLLN